MGDSEREDMMGQAKVVPMTVTDMNRIFQEISSINEKLNTLVRIEEKVLSLSESHTDLKIRINNVEARERASERDLGFAVQQAHEFNKIKDNITINKHTSESTKDSVQKAINWVGVVASALVIAALLNKEPTVVYRDKEPMTKEDKDGL